MHIFLQHRRLHSLIVALAILLNLCAPAIGHAVSALASDPLAQELCSSTIPSPTPADLPTHAVKHCALCALHGGSDAPPPAPAALLAVLEGHHVWLAAPHTIAPQPAIWSDAQARAPPAIA